MFSSLKAYERYRRFAALIAPNRCPFCGDVMSGADYWCNECYRRLPFVYGIVPPPENVSELFVCCFYTGRARDAVLMLKYGGLVYPADAFALMMSRRLRELFAEFDVFVPVPSGRKSISRRGFSSAEIISERLEMRMGIPSVNAMGAVRGKTEQKSLNVRGRHENAKRSFFVAKPELIKGKRIMLVDDVTTTGSTLSVIAEMLWNAGAADVKAVVFAHTPSCAHAADRTRYRIHKRSVFSCKKNIK